MTTQPPPQPDETVRLRAVVERLPVTADGVAVVPGLDVIYSYDGGGVYEVDRDAPWRELAGVWWIMYLRPSGDYEKDVRVSRCFTTREAAEAAMKGTP